MTVGDRADFGLLERAADGLLVSIAVGLLTCLVIVVVDGYSVAPHAWIHALVLAIAVAVGIPLGLVRGRQFVGGHFLDPYVRVSFLVFALMCVTFVGIVTTGGGSVEGDESEDEISRGVQEVKDLSARGLAKESNLRLAPKAREEAHEIADRADRIVEAMERVELRLASADEGTRALAREDFAALAEYANALAHDLERKTSADPGAEPVRKPSARAIEALNRR